MSKEVIFIMFALEQWETKRKQPNSVKGKKKIKLAGEIFHRDMRSNITLHEMAIRVGTNQTYLASYFLSELGCTFTYWKTTQRLVVAKTMIQQTSMSITEIAYNVGYSDPSNFSKAFKKHFGFTPSRFRCGF